MLVFGSGGHTTELLLMLGKTFDPTSYKKVVFVLGHSDTWSETKIKDFFAKQGRQDLMKSVTLVRIYRSREVKQSYITSLLTTLIGLMHSFKMILEHKPDIVR